MNIQSSEYFNAIADSYEEMVQHKSGRETRSDIKNYIEKVRGINTVLDFGGGSGLDLPWLLEYEKVIFCEPADRLREKVESLSLQEHQKRKLIVPDDSFHDFRNWSGEHFDQDHKVEALLANFGVINNIEELEVVFEKWDLAIRKNGHLFISALKFSSLKALLFPHKRIRKMEYNGAEMKVYYYTPREIISAADPYFKLLCKFQTGSFTFYHFVK